MDDSSYSNKTAIKDIVERAISKLSKTPSRKVIQSCPECERLRAELEAIKKKIDFTSRRFEAEEDHANWLEEQNKQLRAELEAANIENKLLKGLLLDMRQHQGSIQQYIARIDAALL